MSIDDRKRLLRLGATVMLAAVCLWMTSRAWAADGEDAGATTRRAIEPAQEKPAGGQAQAEKKEEKKEEEKGKGGGLFGGMTPFLLIIGVFVLMYVFMGSSRRKRETKRRQMLANVKKGDRITTIGGICGTVADVREDEVVVKVDENVRMHVARWAVRGIGEEAKAEKPEDKK